MHSQFLVDGVDSHQSSKMRFCKGIALGFGAGLVLATVVTMSVSPNAKAAEPSNLLASALPTASQSSSLRGGSVIAHGLFRTRDGAGHIGQGSTAVLDPPTQEGYSQPYQQPTSAQVPQEQYSPEQLEFLHRVGKMSSMEQQVQQSTSAQQVPQGEYSPEQLEFMRRAGKLPNDQTQYQQSTSAQGQYSDSQLQVMRRKMEDQYQRPTTSWDSPTFEAAQGRRDGYAAYHNQRFN